MSDHNYTFKSMIMFAFQHSYLAQVTSNIWGTKFKIVGLASFLPANLGAGKNFLSKMFCFLYCSAHNSQYSASVVVYYLSLLCLLVIYKTSLLHLQPRQMTIYLPEVRKISLDFMSLPVFNPNVFSEDEDDLPGKHF